MRTHPSIQRRLLAVAILAGLAGVGAVLVLLLIARTTLVEKRAFSRESALREVARLYEAYAEAPTPETRRFGIRTFGDFQSGFMKETFRDEWGGSRFYPEFYEARTKAAKESKERNDVAVEETQAPDGGTFVIAVQALPDTGYAWAAQKIQVRPNIDRLRVAALALGLASLVLAMASLHTLVVFRRGILSILRSLRLLQGDLSADVPTPALTELATIAEGVSTLARGLLKTENERDVLADEVAAKERLAALGRVVAGVAHEVRNPLAAMKLRVDMAVEAGDIGPRHERELLVVASEIRRLDRLVSDLLIVAGTHALKREPHDLGDLVRERTQLLRPWAAERGVQLVATGTARANIDIDGVSRLIDNLVRNAVEASPEGSVACVVVSVEENGAARFEVFDEGDGVPPEHASELFEPFFTLKPKGTGLGLAISRSIAAAHGSTLRYRREGDRTCFAATFEPVASGP